MSVSAAATAAPGWSDPAAVSVHSPDPSALLPGWAGHDSVGNTGSPLLLALSMKSNQTRRKWSEKSAGWLGTERIWDSLYSACGGSREVNDPLFHLVFDTILVAMAQRAA